MKLVYIDRPMALAIALLVMLALLVVVGVALSGYGNCC